MFLEVHLDLSLHNLFRYVLYEEPQGQVCLERCEQSRHPQHKAHDYELELTYNYDHGPYVVGDGFAHIALSTPDLEALHKEHSEKGYEVTEPKGLPGTQPNYYFVKDPDGYKVEVIREK